MNEIKFRGKRIDNCDWVYGHYSSFIVAKKKIVAITDDNGTVYMIDPETVGQFVDYYSVDFFDGDFFSIACDCDSEYGCNHGDVIYLVEWSKETAGYVLKDISNDRQYPLNEFGEENMRVIGNKHDNPELLTA